jgi:hypothetical protein
VLIPPLTPALMAYYFSRLYKFNNLKFYQIMLCFYFGFFLFDRTLLLALAFAGKNALQYGFFLFPSVFYSFFKENNTHADKAIAAASIVGLILVHYSFLFMFTTLAFFHLLINYKIKSKETLTLFSIYLCALALFFPFYLHLKNADFISIHMEGSSLSLAWNFFKQTFFTLNEPLSDYLFGLSIGKDWSYKKVLLLLIMLILTGYLWIKKKKYKQGWTIEDTAFFKATLVYSLSIAASILLVCFFLAKPIFHVEYVKWYIHIYFSLLASTFLIFIGILVFKLQNIYLKKLFAVIFFIILPIVTSLYLKDVGNIRIFVNFLKTPYSTMGDLENTLDKLSTKNTIVSLITESELISGMGWNATTQNYRPLEYSSVLSNCRILNGSWLILPFDKSRDIDNLPSKEFFSSIKNNNPLYFIVKEETMKQYLNKVNSIYVNKLNLKINDFSIYNVLQK